MPRCPGQDMRYWKPQDIFDVPCFACGASIEFWKDEPFRLCKACGKENRNPRIDLGCAKWCKYADECLGKNAAQPVAPVAPLIDRLELLLEGYLSGDSDAPRRLRRMLERGQQFTQARNVDPCVIQAGAMLLGAVHKMPPDQIPWAESDAMLQRAGLKSDVAGRVCGLVRSVLSIQDDATEEYRVLSDCLNAENSNPRG